MNLLARSKSSVITLNNRKEVHWGLIHLGQNWKMLCIFPPNSSVYRNCSYVALWWTSNEFLHFSCSCKGYAVLGSNLHCPSETPQMCDDKRGICLLMENCSLIIQWVPWWQWHRCSGCGHKAGGPQWSVAGWR